MVVVVVAVVVVVVVVAAHVGHRRAPDVREEESLNGALSDSICSRTVGGL